MPARSRDYDPTLFQSTAYYYARYRDWPEELFAALEEALALDGRGRLLDLGCGTGQLAIPLAAKFEEVVGVDPDPEMLEEARRLAAQAGATNIRWVQARAEDVSSTLGMFRLVTIGSAFHWMHRERVLDTLYDMVGDGGAVAVIDGHGGHDPHPWPVIKEIVRATSERSGARALECTRIPRDGMRTSFAGRAFISAKPSLYPLRRLAALRR